MSKDHFVSVTFLNNFTDNQQTEEARHKAIFCYNKKIKVDNDRNSKRFESVYSKKVRAGKRRTYFFDVRRTKGEDFYLTLTESTKKFDGGYERHKIFLYKEDFNRFVQGLDEAVNYIKTELMKQAFMRGLIVYWMLLI